MRAKEIKAELGKLVEGWRRSGWTSPPDELREVIARCFPEKAKAPEAGKAPESYVMDFPVLGPEKTWYLTEELLQKVADTYEMPVDFLRRQLAIVRGKIESGAMSKKTGRGMPAAVWNWARVAKEIHVREVRMNGPQGRKLTLQGGDNIRGVVGPKIIDGVPKMGRWENGGWSWYERDEWTGPEPWGGA